MTKCFPTFFVFLLHHQRNFPAILLCVHVGCECAMFHSCCSTQGRISFSHRTLCALGSQLVCNFVLQSSTSLLILPGFYSSVLRIFQNPSKIPDIFTRHHLIPRPEDEGDPSAVAARRNQTTAVILCGVLGALFDLEQERSGGGNVADPPALHPALVRLTAKALMYLVLAPPSDTMPSHTPLRRAAIDLIGRGFTLWEPHLEVSKVLLGLLDTSSEADR